MPLLVTIHDSPENEDRISAYYRRIALYCRHDRAALSDLSRRYRRGLHLRWYWQTFWNALDRESNITPIHRLPTP